MEPGFYFRHWLLSCGPGHFVTVSIIVIVIITLKTQ